MLAAGIDVKTVSDTLGHSDTRITRDIYQSVLPYVGKTAAEATAKLVPLQRKTEAEKARKAAEKAREKAKARAKAKKKSGRKKPKSRARSRSSHASLTQTVPTASPSPDAGRPRKPKGQVTPYVTWLLREPPVGFEPTTYALQVRCSGQLS